MEVGLDVETNPPTVEDLGNTVETPDKNVENLPQFSTFVGCERKNAETLQKNAEKFPKDAENLLDSAETFG